MRRRFLLNTAICTIVLFLFGSAQARTIQWKGHDWNVTTGGMAGVALGDPDNIHIGADGFLQFTIVERDGKWTASEIFTQDNMGFGTYQWVVEGNVYDMDKSAVLGLFTYGPANSIGVDGENEIDIEFSQWNKTCGGCNADFTVYPSTGNRRVGGAPSWEDNFFVDGKGKHMITARMEWRSEKITFTIMNGIQPIGTTSEVIKTETYSSNTQNIPQEASPVGINLWCFETTPSSDQSVVIRDFQFVPQ
jgi:hypothetical protein